MKINIQKDWTKKIPETKINGFWGMATFGRETQNIKNLLVTQLNERTDIDWAAGDNWCIIYEKNDISDFTLSCSKENRTSVAVSGHTWPLDDKNEQNAELIAGLYSKYKDRVINYCDGQFSTVIVDEENSRIVLTMNWPGGFRKLYYCTDGYSIAFASRIDLLIHRTGWNTKINEQAVVDLLRFGGLVDDSSLLHGIYQVIPGYAVVFENGNITQKMVYEYPSHNDIEPLDGSEMVRLHREAIQKRISGDKDFGLFLSGGLDSAMNVAIAAELSSKPVKTFNVAFDSDEFDESSYARLVASKYNTEHIELCLDITDCLDRLPEMVWAMQEPIIDYSYIPTFYVAEAIKQHVDIAVGGDGPDHLLGRNYQYAAWYNLLHGIPLAYRFADWFVNINHKTGKLRYIFWNHARRKRLGRQLWQALACAAIPSGSGMLNSYCNDLWGDLPANDVYKLLSRDLLQRTNVKEYNQVWRDRWKLPETISNQVNMVLADASLGGLCGVFAKVGTMCSAHNLILHEPYLSTPLVRYFCGLNDSWKVHGSSVKRLTRTVPASQTKLILRQAAKDYLPDEISLHKKKHGFEFPLVKCWQHSTSGVSTGDIFKTVLNFTDWFDNKYLEKLVKEQANGIGNHRYLLLLIAALDQWFKIYIQSNAVSPAWRWPDCFN